MFEKIKKIFSSADPAKQNENAMVKAEGLNTIDLIAASHLGNFNYGFFENFYQLSFIGRNDAIQYSTVASAVNLIAGVASLLLTNPDGFRIVKNDGSKDSSYKADALTEMLISSLNGYDPSSHTIQALQSDICLEGNAVAAVGRNSRGKIIALMRCNPTSAYINTQSSVEREYVVDLVDLPNNEGLNKSFMSSSIVHAKWAALESASINTNKYGFAVAPIHVMRPYLSGGIEIDRYVANWARNAPEQTLNISLGLKQKDEPLPPEQVAKISKIINTTMKNRRKAWVNYESTATDVTPKIDKDLMDRSKWQTSEVSKFYRIPLPLLGGESITQWGSGLQSVSELAKAFGFLIWIKNLADAIAMKCLDRGSTIELNFAKLISASPADTAALLNVLTGAGGNAESVITKGEARQLAGFPMEWDGELMKNPSNQIESQSGTNGMQNSLILPGNPNFHIS